MNYAPNESWYNLNQIYFDYGVRPSKVRYAIKKGYLECAKVTAPRGDGYRYLVKKSSLLRWLKNPPKRGHTKKAPGPIVTMHYIRDEEPPVIKDFTSVANILKEGETMTVGEVKDMIDNAIVEDSKQTYSEEGFGEGWVTVEEAATLSDRNKSTIKSAIRKGKLKATKYHCNVPGKYDFKWMIKLEDLQIWMDNIRPYKSGQKKEPKQISEVDTEVIEIGDKCVPVISSSVTAINVPDMSTAEAAVYAAFDAVRKEGYDEGYSAGEEAGYHRALLEIEGKLNDLLNSLG